MSRPEINSFTSFVLSDMELLQGSILTAQQLQVVQNDLAFSAEQRLNLDLDPKNIVKFAQDEAFLKGQMSAYRHILLRSLESESQLQARAAAQANSETTNFS